MKSVSSILVLLVLTGSVFASDPVRTRERPESSLRPAPAAALRRIPDSQIYRPVWNESTAPAIQQTQLVTVFGEESSRAPQEPVSSTASSPPAAATPARPFFDLSQDSSAEVQATPTGQGTSELFVRLVVWTVIVLCLCVLTMLGLRRWQQRQGILPAKAGHGRVLETLSIGPGRAVSLVQLGDVRAVVGTDGSGIRTIVLAPAAFADELSDLESATPAADSSEHSPSIAFRNG